MFGSFMIRNNNFMSWLQLHRSIWWWIWRLLFIPFRLISLWGILISLLGEHISFLRIISGRVASEFIQFYVSRICISCWMRTSCENFILTYIFCGGSSSRRNINCISWGRRYINLESFRIYSLRWKSIGNIFVSIIQSLSKIW